MFYHRTEPYSENLKTHEKVDKSSAVNYKWVIWAQQSKDTFR